MKSNKLKNIKRIVVKVGTSTLTGEEATLDVKRIEQLVYQMAMLNQNGYEVIFVSSGAVGTGNRVLNIEKNTTISQKQASAAVGQIIINNLYEELFSKYDINIAQLLLTKDDITNRERNLNIRNVINQLLKMRIIPIINENDAITTKSIKIGDNDNLSALIAILSDASLLVLLSDIDGIYTDNPMKNVDAKFLEEIEKVDSKIMSYARDKGSKFAVGGMQTKLEAAKKVNAAGIQMIIANGQKDNILLDIVQGNFKGSLFLHETTRLAAKKKWLLLSSNSHGRIIIDNGARDALVKGTNSLLPIGVIKVEGLFNSGSVVDVIDEDGVVIGRGVCNYDSNDVDKIKRMKNEEFKKQDYEKYIFDTIIHIDNLVLIKEID